MNKDILSAFPLQSEQLGKTIPVEVFAETGHTDTVPATVVRADKESPFHTIAVLESGQVVVDEELSGYTHKEQSYAQDQPTTVRMDTSTPDYVEGTFARYDAERGGRKVIHLITGQWVLSTECVYQAAPSSDSLAFMRRQHKYHDSKRRPTV